MKVIHGNNLDVLKQYPDNYFDAIVTDPPYGLGKEPDAVEVMQSWVETGYHEVKGGGFMGKEWDAFVPQPLFWKEVFRVLKHGGHVLAFYGTRTYDWGVMAMRFAGFEVRDTIYWHYGSGFPKSHNIGKALDRLHGHAIENKSEFTEFSKTTDTTKHIQRYKKCTECEKLLFGQDPCSCEWRNHEGISEDAKKWNGWGSALKPASEPIVLARKPLEKGLSISENVLKYGTGGINIEECRVKYSEINQPIPQLAQGKLKVNSSKTMFDGQSFNKSKTEAVIGGSLNGRFPANLVMSHHPECRLNGLKKVKGSQTSTGAMLDSFKNIQGKRPPRGIGDENNEETIEDWCCHENCPIRIMDEQSGQSKSPKTYIRKSDGKNTGNTYQNNVGENAGMESKNFGDSGGASRFFPHLNYDAEEYNRFLYTAKASKSERNKGLDGFEEKPLAFSNQAKAELKRGNENFDGGEAKGHGNSIRHLKNFHPTVKPVQLMRWLVRLVTPPNGIVLDPFCGSGTTGIACKVEGFDFVGIEQDADYCKIAEARIENWIEKEPVVERKEPIKEEPETKYVQTSLF